MSMNSKLTEMHSQIENITDSIDNLEKNSNSTNINSNNNIKSNSLINFEKGLILVFAVFLLFKYYGFEFFPDLYDFVFLILNYTVEYIKFDIYLNFILPLLNIVLILFILGNIIIFPIILMFSNGKHTISKLQSFDLMILQICLIIISISFGISQVISDGGSYDNTDEASKSAWENMKLSWLKFKCDSYAELTKDPKCEILKNDNQNTVSKSNEISIRVIDDDRKRITLIEEKSNIAVRYEFNTPVEIKLDKIECFTNKDKNNPFFINTELETKLINANTEVSKRFVCDNLGKVLKEKTEKYNIYSYLYFTIENSYSQKIPTINCNNHLIRKFLEKKDSGYICQDLTLKILKDKNILEIPDYKASPDGSNALVLNTHSFTKDLPVRIGDDRENSFSLDISLKENRIVGEIISASIIDIKLPNTLKFKGDEESKFDYIINNDIKLDQIDFLHFELLENENVDISNNNAIILQEIIIKTKAQFKKKWKVNDITLVADFEISNENINNNNNNNTNLTSNNNSNIR